MTNDEVEGLLGGLSGVIVVTDGVAGILRSAHVVAPGKVAVFPRDADIESDPDPLPPRVYPFTSATKSGSGVVFECPEKFGLEIHPLHASISGDIRDFYASLPPLSLDDAKELLP